MLVPQFSVKKSLIEFHENPTGGLVADTGSETDRQTNGYGLLMRCSYFSFVKEEQNLRCSYA